MQTCYGTGFRLPHTTHSHTRPKNVFTLTHRFPPQNTSLHYQIPKGFIQTPPFAHLPTILIIDQIHLDVSMKAVYLNKHYSYLTLRLWRPINLKITTTFPAAFWSPPPTLSPHGRVPHWFTLLISWTSSEGVASKLLPTFKKVTVLPDSIKKEKKRSRGKERMLFHNSHCNA